jgi:hypothetical protein
MYNYPAAHGATGFPQVQSTQQQKPELMGQQQSFQQPQTPSQPYQQPKGKNKKKWEISKI